MKFSVFDRIYFVDVENNFRVVRGVISSVHRVGSMFQYEVVPLITKKIPESLIFNTEWEALQISAFIKKDKTCRYILDLLYNNDKNI